MSNKGHDFIDRETGEVLNHKGRRLDHAGREIPDPRQVPPPPGYKRQPTMADHIRDLIRSHELQKEAEAAGAESFDEADDFDVGEDYDPTSPYEGDFDPIDYKRLRDEVDRRKKGLDGEASRSATPTDAPPSPSPVNPPKPE